MSSWLIAAPIVVPLAAGTAQVLITTSRASARVDRVATAALVMAVVALAYAVGAAGTQHLHAGGWPQTFAIHLVADGAAVLMLVVVAIAALVTSLYRHGHGDAAAIWFLIAGAAGGFLAGDLFNLYVWFEVTILASVVIQVADPATRDLGRVRSYVVVNLIASALLLVGVGLLYGATGTVHLASLAPAFAALDAPVQLGIASTIVVAFAIKAGAFPLFAWLPGSYAAMPPAQLALISALLTKLAAYAMLRVLGGPLHAVLPAMQPLLLVLACATMLAGVLGALAQTDLRRLLSFHIVSQIGYLLLAVALATPDSATGFFVFVAHVACAKAALFLIAGLVAREGGSYDLRRLGGLCQSHPRLALLFAAAALALAGMPPLSGFWGKLFVVHAALDQGAWIATGVALAVSLLTLLSMLKIWMYAFWRPAPVAADVRPAPGAAAAGHRPAIAATLMVGLTVIAGLIPGLLHGAAQRAAHDLTAGWM